MSMGPYALYSPVHGCGRAPGPLQVRAVWGGAPKTLPGVPRRGPGVPRPVHCGAAHFSGMLASNQPGIHIPAGDSSRPSLGFPSQGNGCLLVFSSLDELADPSAGVGIIRSRSQPLYCTVFEPPRVALQ
jgi:hypothetical protein